MHFLNDRSHPSMSCLNDMLRRWVEQYLKHSNTINMHKFLNINIYVSLSLYFVIQMQQLLLLFLIKRFLSLDSFLYELRESHINNLISFSFISTTING